MRGHKVCFLVCPSTVICDCLPHLPDQLNFLVSATEASRPHPSDCHFGVTDRWNTRRACLWVWGEERKKGMCHKAGICRTNDVTADMVWVTAGK